MNLNCNLCVIAALPYCLLVKHYRKSQSTRRFGRNAQQTTVSRDGEILGDSCHVNMPHLLRERSLTEVLTTPDRPQLL